MEGKKQRGVTCLSAAVQLKARVEEAPCVSCIH